MKSALLVIDLQRGLLETTPPPFELEATLDRINELARRARAAECPVIFIQHERAGSPLVHGCAAWQLHPRLTVADSDLHVRKSTPDSFLGTDLKRLLDTHHVDQVVVSGYASEFCIDTTVRRAASLGYRVTLVADAHTTHDKAHAPAAQIRLHENATLPQITSFGPKIRALDGTHVVFAA